MLTGKTIGQLTNLENISASMKIPVELTGKTYHINYSGVTANIRPYKVYTAQLSTGSGLFQVYENTLGVNLTWNAPQTGELTTGVVVGLIGQNNVYVQVTDKTCTVDPKIVGGCFSPSPWRVDIVSRDSNGNLVNTDVYVEIRIYN